MSVVAMLQGTETADRGTLRTALAIGRKMNVGVTGLFALPDPDSAFMIVGTPEGAGLTAQASQSIIDMQAEMKRTAEAVFAEVVGNDDHGVQSAFLHEVNLVERAAANAATLAEAVVFPRSSANATAPLYIAFEHVLMDARLPLVLAGSGDPAPGPAVIAWDGSNGAARAVRFHLPLIRAIGDVIIAQNRKDLGRDTARPVAEPDTLARWLKRYNVTTSDAAIEEDVGAGLLALAQGSGASMIVAGAYGHSRLGERLFGGTTRTLLAADTAPALALSH
jgi:nucleotide-binding universal stress UspA family protein